MGKKFVSIVSEQSGRMTALGLLVTLSVSMVLSGVLFSSAQAATLVSVSDLVSESAPSSASDHTITFTVQNAVPASGKIVISFASAFTEGALEFGDVDLKDDGADLVLAAAPSGTDWGAVFTTDTLTLTNGSAAIAAGSVVEIQIGKHATFGTNGDTQMTNPSTSNASYSVYVKTTTSGDVTIDDATTYVAIVPTVELTAEVASYFYFRVEGQSATTIDGFALSSASQDGWANFGVLTANSPVTMGSSLSARTNATNGFTVTLEQNHNMLASSGADIDAFANGTPSSGAAWSSPTGTLGSENTYGHLGFYPTTNNDAGVASSQWFGLNGTTKKTIWSHNGPADGATEDVGTAKVLYRVEVSPLQEVGRYESRLMYIGTATF